MLGAHVSLRPLQGACAGACFECRRCTVMRHARTHTLCQALPSGAHAQATFAWSPPTRRHATRGTAPRERTCVSLCSTPQTPRWPAASQPAGCSATRPQTATRPWSAPAGGAGCVRRACRRVAWACSRHVWCAMKHMAGTRHHTTMHVRCTRISHAHSSADEHSERYAPTRPCRWAAPRLPAGTFQQSPSSCP
jgi:hypothetical protein